MCTHYITPIIFQSYFKDTAMEAEPNHTPHREPAVLPVNFPMEMRSYSNLPEEITVDILSRVPAKIVGRCRCVSKPWRDLLSQPNFIRTHLDRSRNFFKPSLLLNNPPSHFYATLSSAHHLFDEITFSVAEISFVDYSFPGRIEDCCDGLLLVEDRHGQMLVINPVTREIREVPPLRFALRPRYSISYGFGYDSVHDDYKVVAIFYYNFDLEDDIDYEDEPYCPETFVIIYSLKTGTWKSADGSPYDHDGFSNSPGICIEGAIHWIRRTSTFKSAVAAFDLAQEKFREVPLPNSGYSSLPAFIVALGGCLCVFNDGADFWIMKEYGVQESWTNFKVDDANMDFFSPLCMLGQEHVLIDNWKLMVYNLKEGTRKDIVVHGIENNLCVARSFVESLVSPHGTRTNETGRE